MTNPLLAEFEMLVRAYGQVQRRCSTTIAGQALRIGRLRRELLRVRGAVIRARTAHDWGLDPLACGGSPGPRASTGLTAPAWHRRSDLRLDATRLLVLTGDSAGNSDQRGESKVAPDLAAAIAQADLVICRTGCTSHDDFWRIADLCRRTGRPCVLVQEDETAAEGMNRHA